MPGSPEETSASHPSGGDPFVGQILHGRYTILGRVAEGGMSVVYRAAEARSGETRAVKLLSSALVGDPAAEERFLDEGETARRIHHPSAIHVHESGRLDDGKPFLVMELLEGRLLSEVIEDEAPLPEVRVVHLMRQIAGAMAEAHRQGFIHRDLKPDNIMVVPAEAKGEERAVVLDFGIAVPIEKARGRPMRGKEKLGTVAYASPEQGEGEPLDMRTDVYSLGVVMFQMLTGRHPLEVAGPRSGSDSGRSAADDRAGGRPGRDSPVEVSRTLQNIVLRAFKADPTQRHHDARELLHDLERIDLEAPEAAARLDWERLRWIFLILAAAVLLLTLFALAGRLVGWIGS